MMQCYSHSKACKKINSRTHYFLTAHCTGVRACARVCIYIYIYMCVCVCVCVCVNYVLAYICMMYVCIYVCIYICMYLYIYVCIYVLCTHVCMYVCMYCKTTSRPSLYCSLQEEQPFSYPKYPNRLWVLPSLLLSE